MYNLTTKESIIEFETEEQAIKYINKDILKHSLNFEKVYDHTENNFRVMIYLFRKIYTKTYLIQKI